MNTDDQVTNRMLPWQPAILDRQAGIGQQRTTAILFNGNFVSKIFWKMLSILLVSCTSIHVAACEKYDIPGVALTGTLSVETFYGPPNYGESPETDSKERQVILHLTKSLCTNASQDDPAEKDQFLVTVAPMDNFGLRQFVGKIVNIRGSLFHAINGHHHTAVLIAIHELPVITLATSSR